MAGFSGRVFLVGLMGAGKSTVGRRLAGELGCPYLDNDSLLEAQTHAQAADLARSQDPTVLHRAEATQLHELLARPGPFVAGVAASVADRPDDRAATTRAGFVVYLRASPEMLAGRVEADAPRPWLADDPLAVLREMQASRDQPLRSMADLVVDTDTMPADELDARILAAVRAHVEQR